MEEWGWWRNRHEESSGKRRKEGRVVCRERDGEKRKGTLKVNGGGKRERGKSK